MLELVLLLPSVAAFAGGPIELPGAEPLTASAPLGASFAGQTASLGLLDSASLVDGKAFPLNEWQHVAFSIEAPHELGLGQPTVSGLPAHESKLEYKHTVRALTLADKTAQLFRHDYSWLALGATPEGEYAVSFPGGPSFAVSVAHLDKSTPQERMRQAAETIKRVWSQKDAEPDFAPNVPERVRNFISPHQRLMEKVYAGLDRYYAEDPVLTAEAKAEKLGALARVREFYDDVIGGRTRYQVDGVVAQLLARERGFLNDYAAYVRADPAIGKTGGELRVEQLERHRETMRTLYEAFSKVDASRPPTLFERSLGGALKAYVRFRMWLAARRLRR